MEVLAATATRYGTIDGARNEKKGL